MRKTTREEKIVRPGVYMVDDTQGYLAAREWVNLTDAELNDLTAIYSGMPLYRAIEAKLKEKNT